MLSSSRFQALADTLDWLEERCRAGPVEIRCRTHDGRTLKGVLTEVTRRHVAIAEQRDAPATILAAGEIAKIWVPQAGRRTSGLRRWEVWFDYGSA